MNKLLNCREAELLGLTSAFDQKEHCHDQPNPSIAGAVRSHCTVRQSPSLLREAETGSDCGPSRDIGHICCLHFHLWMPNGNDTSLEKRAQPVLSKEN